MIDFSTLQGLTIPEGVVTQITDASGRVLWKLANDKPIILEVEKITADTYAGETAYTGEQFILLDIYPKKNGTVTVTYGGLTKTITDTSGFENPNALKVFFGTFNGVSDSVSTPTSGTLIIEGDCSNFACASYQNDSKVTSKKYCGCITGVTDWGNIESIMSYAFSDCLHLTSIDIPSNITSIGSHAFYNCSALALTSLPSGITSIGSYVFYGCSNLALTELPSGITSIGDSAFSDCSALALTSLPNGITSIGDYTFEGCKKISITDMLRNGITSIGAFAFSGTKDVSEIIVPDGVTQVGQYGLSVKFTKLTIPETMRTIGGCAFYGGSTTDRRTVYMLGSTPPTLGVNDYDSYSNFGRYPEYVTIIVPKGCANAYKTEESWIASGFADRVTEAS